jgi:holo-[acyl-carrier protein] synthase
MIAGIGIDVVSIERMRAAIARHGGRFEKRILSEIEREQIADRANQAEAVAARFAAKEAAFKALGGPSGLAWREIQVLREPSGAPRIEWCGAAATCVRRLGNTRTFVSLTHDAGVAAAVVVLETLP